MSNKSVLLHTQLPNASRTYSLYPFRRGRALRISASFSTIRHCPSVISRLTDKLVAVPRRLKICMAMPVVRKSAAGYVESNPGVTQVGPFATTQLRGEKSAPSLRRNCCCSRLHS